MRILVIEDSGPTRELLQHSLGSAGHAVTVAARLSTGRELAQEETFDVIIIDIMLPDGSGLDLCQDLRGDGITTPILFLTARGEVSDRIVGLDAGADDYLRKPFAIAELQARVRALGRRQGRSAPARLEWSGTSIDFTGRKFVRGSREVPLTAREWTVLELLAAQAGRIVSRAALLESAWGDVSDAASESLDVIMSRLRRKLERSGQSECLRTVRGQGYVFEIPR